MILRHPSAFVPTMNSPLTNRGGGVGCSKLIHQITHTHTKSFGDLFKRFERDAFFGTLNLPDIVAVQISLFGQFFLAQTSSPAPGANGFANDLVNLGTRHSVTKTRTDETSYRLIAVKCCPMAGIISLAVFGKKIQGRTLTVGRRAE
jgi:hypothetical protein